MYLSRIVFKRPRAGHKASSRVVSNFFEEVDTSSFEEEKFPGNPLKRDGKQRWIHAERVKKGSQEMHLIDYQSSFLRLTEPINKDNLGLHVGVHRCLVKYKGSQADLLRSLVSVWPSSERDLIEVLLEDNQTIPRDRRGVMLLPVDQISDRAWHSMPVNPKKIGYKDLRRGYGDDPHEYLKKYSSLVAVSKGTPGELKRTPGELKRTPGEQEQRIVEGERIVEDEIADEEMKEIIGSRTVHTMRAVPLKEDALKRKIDSQLDSLYRGNVHVQLNKKGHIFKEKYKLNRAANNVPREGYRKGQIMKVVAPLNEEALRSKIEEQLDLLKRLNVNLSRKRR